MRDLLEKIRHNYQLILRGIVAIISIAAIVFIFPSEVKFKYEFQKAKPWLHDNLIAPFDFPIFKAEVELQEDLQKAEKSVSVYYRIKPEIKEENLNQFEVLFIEKWNDEIAKKSKGYFNNKTFSLGLNKDTIKNLNLKTGIGVLTKIYEKGIYAQDEIFQGKEETFEFNLIDENTARKAALRDLNSLQQAHIEALNLIKNEPQVNTDFVISVLDNCLEPNITYDQSFTENLIAQAKEQVSETRGVVLKNEKIIDRGQVVKDDLFQKLESLRREYEGKKVGIEQVYLVRLGEVFLVGLVVLVLLIFITIFRKDVINVNNRLGFIFLVFTLTIYMAAISFYFPQININVLPFCILPILIRAFFDERLATFTYTLAIILIGFFAPNSFEFVFIQLITGTLVVLYLVSIRKRSQLLSASFVIFGVYSLSYLGFAIIQEGDWQKIEYMNIAWYAGSAILVMLVYPLIFLFEKAFGFLSDITLMELSDTNHPLLKGLATQAPGTFQHSLQVANLAEAACDNVGGDSMLIRVGALYHDIGKTKNPQFFIENQISGHNPHDELNPKESAKIIINHVIDGVEMAKKQNLPEILIDFIRTHHGTSMTRYFYNTLKNEIGEEKINKKDFTYPGPLPFSKETAILMMADSVEAASRSLPKYDEETINNLVENIINNQAAENQFINADITFKELSKIKQLFKKMLQNIYHIRIAYPK
jgi:cyclic-di-AMP phosphodiesterase PgpH